MTQRKIDGFMKKEREIERKKDWGGQMVEWSKLSIT